jgi:hypothetical protein
MKAFGKKFNDNEGSVLLTTMGVCGVLVILMASYLKLIQTQRSSVGRAQAWNAALTVAEAGIEEAMAHINSGVSSSNLAVNTWSAIRSGVVGKTNFLGTSYYFVTIQTSPAVTNTTPVLTSTSYVPGPISGPMLGRTIQVTTKGNGGPGGRAAIVTDGAVSFSGFNVTVDSFDSSNTNYSTGGQYDANKRLDNGDIIDVSTATNAVYIGDSKVYGTIHTAPGVTVGVDTAKGAGDSVGNSAWVDGGNVGIETGHAVQDASLTIPDVTLPNNLIWLPPVSTHYKVNGVMYDYVLDNTAPWKLATLSSSVYVSSPNVVLYVTGSLSLGSGTEIYLAPGASLSLYVGAASATIGGQGVVNSSGLAQNFHYYGLPSNTSFGLQANASFTGVLDAPEAVVTIGGGGSSPYDFAGQVIAASVKMNGHFNIHFDQALSTQAFPGMGPSSYTATFWQER